MDWSDEAVRTLAREHPELELGNLVPLLRLESIARSFEAFQRSVLEPFELAASDFRVLAALRQPGSPRSQSPSQLATRLGHTTGGMTKILRRLEARGFVERRANPEDGRGFRVEPTSRGSAIWERVLLGLAAAADQRLASLPRQQRDEIGKALAQLAAAFEGESRPR